LIIEIQIILSAEVKLFGESLLVIFIILTINSVSDSKKGIEFNSLINVKVFANVGADLGL